MEIFPFQAWYPNFDLIASPDSFFASVKEEYVTYKQSGFFNQLKEKNLFFYQIKSYNRTYTGLIACTNVQEYENGCILKHESTLSAKEQKMIQLFMQRKAIVKPILLAYPSVKDINDLIFEYIRAHTPLFTTFFEQEQQEHFLWKVSDDLIIQKIKNCFQQKIKFTYIADGHHRTTTMTLLNQRLKNNLEYGDYNQLMVALFGSDQLDILEYNRVIEGLNECSPTVFIAKLSQVFDIRILKRPEKPVKKHEITLFINREWYKLTWKQSVLMEFAREKAILDVALLNKKVIKEILDIEDVRFDQRIHYIAGTKGLEGMQEATIKSKNRIGFYLYPVQLSELMALADMRQLLPPKSTWFEPRIKNGLLVKSLV